MIYGLIVSIIFMLSLAFVVMALANKEQGNMKLTGQVLSILIVIIAVIALILGATGKNHMMMGRGMMDKGMMGDKMDCKMMMEKMKKDPSMMKEMMKDKDMKKMMEKNMKSMSK
jgi:fumarate reductase subunit C